MDQREQDQQFSISASEYWFSQQRQSIWSLISLIIVILVGLGGFYPHSLAFGDSIVYVSDLAYIWTHWAFPYFFFLVTLEARREIISTRGELYGNKALAPVIMALGGMVVPWLVYTYITGSGDPKSGAFIPMATDIAFVVLALTVANASPRLRAALLSLAIADDIGSIILMAIFFNEWGYSQFLTLGVMTAVLYLCYRYERALDQLWIYRAGFVWVMICFFWIYVLNKVHLHPSLAGVFTALVVPYHPGSDRIKVTGRLRDSVYHVLEQAGLNVPVNWIVIPGFIVLSVVIRPENLAGAWFTTQSLGVFLGFVIGKTVGVFCGGYIAYLFIRQIPANSFKELFFGSIMCGMGLTVALFFAGLSTGIDKTTATVAILFASAICGVVGAYGIYYVNHKSGKKGVVSATK